MGQIDTVHNTVAPLALDEDGVDRVGQFGVVWMADTVHNKVASLEDES